MRGLGVRGGLRWVWRQLTSMRTALILLFALAVAAIPGSLLPQRDVNPVRVRDFITQNPVVGPLYDALGLFGVYTSAWFSAIYLMLFVSLIGCIIPPGCVVRAGVAQAATEDPRNLSRLPAYSATTIDTEPDVSHLLDDAEAALRGRRFRVARFDDSVGAERGYLREAGNLVFHLSLLPLLVGVAAGGLWGFRGTSVVVVGQAFSNNISQYDDFSAGGWFSAEQLRPFTVTATDFRARFEAGPVQTGAARLFELDAVVADQFGNEQARQTLEVNKPMFVDGTTVHLIGHGYAPEITVKDGNGDIAFSGPVVFLPQEGNLTSVGVIKVPDGRPERLAFEGIFAPTAKVDAKSGPRSIFPDLLDPALYVNVWYGPPKVETGRPENVYSLDTVGLSALKTKKGDPVRILLRPGTAFVLPDGKGTIEMTGVRRWVKIQLSDTPGLPVVLGSLVAAVMGLTVSLFQTPRRVWVRIRPDADGRTVIEVGGLDRADGRSGLDDDVHSLAVALAPDPTVRTTR